MSANFIHDLIEALERIAPFEAAPLKDVLIVCGMPEKTQNIQYVGFNRQSVADGNRTLTFSAVAILNNRRAENLRLTGTWERLARLIFSTRWTKNPLDLFLNELRCDTAVMDLLAAARAPYGMLGILNIDTVTGSGFSRKTGRSVRPVLAVPDLSAADLATIETFEARCEIRKSKIKGLPLYYKAKGNKSAG